LKRITAVPIALFVLFITAISASAAQPVRIHLQFPPELPLMCFSPTGVLLFDGVVTIPVNNEVLTIYQDTPTAYRASITGHLVLTYTANGKSVTVNASGPSFDSFRDGTFTTISVGLNAGITIHAGRLVFRIDPYGNATFTEAGHTLLDICAALA
jgi:hypothetical protein